MTLTTQGIVLHTTHYGETSLVARIFTRQLGVRSYMLKGIRSTQGRNKQNLLQPMSHLDMTVNENSKNNLQYIREMHPAAHYNSINTDSVKMALLFFMDEVLYKSLHDEEPNTKLFDYVVEQIDTLDKTTDGTHSTTLPIEFLLRSSRHLGIEPMNNYSSHEPLFNLKEGMFTPVSHSTADTVYTLGAAASRNMYQCIEGSLHHQHMPELDASQRHDTLQSLLHYYQIHLSSFNNFKSHEVLHGVLR